jgi:hypothetical protein
MTKRQPFPVREETWGVHLDGRNQGKSAAYQKPNDCTDVISQNGLATRLIDLDSRQLLVVQVF